MICPSCELAIDQNKLEKNLVSAGEVFECDNCQEELIYLDNKDGKYNSPKQIKLA
jgi:hypothetical protein